METRGWKGQQKNKLLAKPGGMKRELNCPKCLELQDLGKTRVHLEGGEGEWNLSFPRTVHLHVNAYASDPPSSPLHYARNTLVDKPLFLIKSMALHVIIQKQRTKTNFPQRSSWRN